MQNWLISLSEVDVEPYSTGNQACAVFTLKPFALIIKHNVQGKQVNLYHQFLQYFILMQQVSIGLKN